MDIQGLIYFGREWPENREHPERSQESTVGVGHTNIQRSHPNSQSVVTGFCRNTGHTHMIKVLLGPKIAYLVDRKNRAHGLINLLLLAISLSLGTTRLSCRCCQDNVRPSVGPEAEPPGCLQNYHRKERSPSVARLFGRMRDSTASR